MGLLWKVKRLGHFYVQVLIGVHFLLGVGSSHATWEEEDEHSNHDIQHQIGIAREVKDQTSQQTFRHESLHGWLGTNDGHHHLVGCIDGGHGFDQKGNEERGRESICVEVVGQCSLHGIGLKTIRKLLQVFQQSSIIGLHSQAHVDAISHHVGGDQVQRNVEHTGETWSSRQC